jgi:hypothetical protein
MGYGKRVAASEGRMTVRRHCLDKGSRSKVPTKSKLKNKQ